MTSVGVRLGWAWGSRGASVSDPRRAVASTAAARPCGTSPAASSPPLGARAASPRPPPHAASHLLYRSGLAWRMSMCYGPTGRGTRTGHASGTRNRHGGATRGVCTAYGRCSTSARDVTSVRQPSGWGGRARPRYCIYNWTVRLRQIVSLHHSTQSFRAHPFARSLRRSPGVARSRPDRSPNGPVLLTWRTRCTAGRKDS
jgi:hypothetical protein